MISRLRFMLPVLGILALPVPGCVPAPQPVEEIDVSAAGVSEAAPISIGQHDWPWWRGATRDNVASCPTAPVEFGPQTNVTWKSPVPGRGHGTPTVFGDQIFLCTADESSQTQMVMAFDRSTGVENWRTSIHVGNFPGQSQMHAKSTHANCTVACDGKSLFVGFLNQEQITATSLTLQGDLRWQQKLGHFGSKFGYAPSPCLFGSLAIYAADSRGGAFIAAVHRESGDVVWRKARNNVSTYSPAIVTQIQGRDLLLLSGDNRIAAFDPADGSEIWSCPGTAEATCGTVVWHNQFVFASGGYPERNTICVDATNGQKVWEDKMKSYEQSMLVAADHLFAVTDDGIAICRDAETGELKWRHRLSGPISASPLLVGNAIYATNEAGTTWVFEASADGFQQLAKNQLGTEAFASLVACDGQILARVAQGHGPNRQETLYCFGQRSSAQPVSE